MLTQDCSGPFSDIDDSQSMIMDDDPPISEEMFSDSASDEGYDTNLPISDSTRPYGSVNVDDENPSTSEDFH